MSHLSISSRLRVVRACASGLRTPSPLSHAAAPVVAVYSLACWIFFLFRFFYVHETLAFTHTSTPTCMHTRTRLRGSSFLLYAFLEGSGSLAFLVPRRLFVTLSRFSLNIVVVGCTDGGSTPAQTDSPTVSHTCLYSNKRSGIPTPSVFLLADTRTRMHALFRPHSCTLKYAAATQTTNGKNKEKKQYCQVRRTARVTRSQCHCRGSGT